MRPTPGPARFLRKILGHVQLGAQAAHPADSLDITERIAVGMRLPHRPLDVIRLHTSHNRRIETRQRRDIGQLRRFILIEWPLGQENHACPQLAVDDSAGPALVRVALQSMRR